jgi:hypothetical protein
MRIPFPIGVGLPDRWVVLRSSTRAAIDPATAPRDLSSHPELAHSQASSAAATLFEDSVVKCEVLRRRHLEQKQV